MKRFLKNLWHDQRGFFPSIATVVGTAGGVNIGLPSFRSLFGDPLGDLKVRATEIVNRVEENLVQNLNRYMAGAATVENQANAITYGETLMNDMRTALVSNPILQSGGVGIRSWAERDRGGIYDYYARYIDPIRNDPRISQVQSTAAEVVGSVSEATGLDAGTSSIAIIGILGLVAWKFLK